MRKIKVMIVDDNKLVIDDIISLFNWDEQGFEIVAIEYNGKKALEKFIEISPEILITDIKMPFMDGIELAQNIRKIDVNTKILLLTAYSDFEYAQNAIKLGVTDYIIKGEITHQMLKEKLLLLKEIIDSENRTSLLISQKMINDLFNSDIHYSNNETTIDSNIRKLFSESFYYYVIDADLPLPFLEDGYFDIKRLTDNEIMSCCLSSEMDEINIVSVGSIQMNRVLVVINEKYYSQNMMMSYLLNSANEMKEILERKLGCSFTVFQINCKLNIFEMKELYKTTYKKRMLAKYLIGNCKVYDIADENLNWADTKIMFESADLINLIEKRESQAIQTFIENLYNQVLLANKDYYSLLNISKALYKILKKYSKTSPISASIARGNYTMFLNGEDVKNWMKNRFERLIAVEKEIYEKKYTKAIIRTIDYINTHYMDTDFAIDKAARNVGLSAGRLSVLFKKESGSTINQYLTDTRMTKAKKLLAESTFKVNEVSSIVGYSSSQYFSQIFKKTTGFYPSEYSRRGLKNAKEN